MRFQPTQRWLIIYFLFLMFLASMISSAQAQTTGKAFLASGGSYRILGSFSGANPTDGVIQGGRYQLSTPALPVKGMTKRNVSVGGGYLLEVQSGLGLTGSGCCCTYLPLLLR
jgi:hypothetical protein